VLWSKGIDATDTGVRVRLKEGSILEAEIALVSIGKKKLCLRIFKQKKRDSLLGAKGEIAVNEQMETSVKGIFAIGDVTGKFMLAHVASHQGVVAGANAAGGVATMHYEAVPAVIFTNPEIATVGMTLEGALEAGFQAVVGKFPFLALGKSIATGATEGFAQVIIDKPTGKS